MPAKELTQSLITTALQRLYVCANFKKKRLQKIDKYYDAYAGLYRPKFRQAFNIPLPVFSGMVDTLLADFDDPINLEFSSENKALMPQLEIASDVWKVSSNSLDPDARWRLQTRLDKKNAVITGVGIQKTFCESDPKFKFYFEAINLKKFIFEPKGGPILERHLFKGMEGIYKRQSQLEAGRDSGRYNPEAVKTILDNLKDNNYRPADISIQITGDQFNQYKAFQQDPEGNNYTGEMVSSCIEMVLSYSGKWYYLLFDPYCQQALIADDLKNIVESGREPYTCWHTHEDDEVFMSKSYGDDFYPVHDAVCTSINQEMTNRRKQNSNARYYDDEMFTDLTKLDEAQWRDDALVPGDTKGGIRRISDGIYQFSTSEMKGTIDLVNFLENDLSKNTGVTEISQAGASKGKVQVQYSLLQQAQKRIGAKAASYNDCYQQVGLRILDGESEHLSRTEAVNLIGSRGYDWKPIPLGQRVNVQVINITEQDQENVLGKDQRIQAVDKISANETLLTQNNPKVLNEMIWRDIGGLKEEQIDRLMDVENYGIEDIMQLAEYCVQRLLKGKMPKPVFNANGAFLKYIYDFETAHQGDLKPEVSKLFLDYIEQMTSIVMNNAQKQKPNQGPGPAGSANPQGAPAGDQSVPVSRQQGPQSPQRQTMAISGGQ